MAREDVDLHGRTSLSIEECRAQIDAKRRVHIDPDGHVDVSLSDDEYALLYPDRPPRSLPRVTTPPRLRLGT